MNYTSKNLPKSQVELTITITPADYQDDLYKAAERLSQRSAVKGFRPGKAPYEIVKQEMGELKIMEEAMQTLVEKNFSQVIKKAKLETIGMPNITIQKIAPGNDFVFTATVALFPQITLGDLDKIKINKKQNKIENAKIDDVLENLRKMQVKEVSKTGQAKKEDKVSIKMEMFIDRVPVEGGQADNHAVYLNEKHYIPGLNEQLIGLNKDQTKEFSLKFPTEHYQKHLAGKNVDFKVKINEIYELKYPELNDDFAKTLGMDSLEKLKVVLSGNLQQEAEQKEEQRIEIEIFDKLIESSKFAEIADVLIDSEKHKMFHELKHSLEQQGIEMEKYLSDIKKTQKQIQQDFSQQAEKRVKAALISRQIALNNNLKVTNEELEQEIEMIKKTYPNDQTVADNLQRPEVRDTLAVAVQNRKVIQWLKDKVEKN